MGGKKKSIEKSKQKAKTEANVEGKIAKSATPKPTPEPTPKKPTPGELLAEQTYAEMKRLAANGIAEFTSTLLRDKLGLDKESGRGQIRRAMKRLEKAGKVAIKQGTVKGGARKRYVYKLRLQ
jgi:hypothetical protein